MMNTARSKELLAALRGSRRSWMDAEQPPAPVGWQIFWTLVWAGGFALLFTVIGFAATARTAADWLDGSRWAIWLGRNYIVAAIISFTIQGLFKLVFRLFGTAWLATLAGWRRTTFFSTVPLLGTAIGWPIGIALIYGRAPMVSALTSGMVISLAVVTLLMSLLFHLYFSLRHKEMRARMRANEAQLRLLQGQMEPHFLFNTLANVICMIDTDAPSAKHTLEALTDYLRASLGSLRDGDSTLGAELELAVRYLQLMQARMGERLRFDIAADDTLRHAALMPLVLQPLIENAVNHGLEPQVEGGTVRVKALRLAVDGRDSLQVCIEDDGAGLAAAASRPRHRVADGVEGNGIALANLRERLRSRFGPAAQLTLSGLEDGRGTRACLVIPWQDARAA